MQARLIKRPASAHPVLNTHWNVYIAFPPLNRQINPMAKTSKAVKKSKKTKRTPNAAFMKPVTPDEKLALVVGDKPLPRTELTKKLWAYIKKNGLQDAKNKTLINADEALKAVFDGKGQVSMFEMTKLVSGHVKK
jgi:chromatin remodeling complex protein RSC6